MNYMKLTLASDVSPYDNKQINLMSLGLFNSSHS